VKTYSVVFAPEARAQLADLYRYIAAAASPDVAARYTEGIVTHCEALSTFPMRARCGMISGLVFAFPIIGSGQSSLFPCLAIPWRSSGSFTAARIMRRLFGMGALAK
jgi:plasmid stabilization system protein ParE